MKTHNNYSPILPCIHDDLEPIGNIGRGSHYSVFEVPQWQDVMGRKRFAIIWDEDHDTRVIEIIEKLFVSGLFHPVQYIGERKGMLTVIVAANFHWGVTNPILEDYKAAVTHIASSDNSADSWSTEFGMFDKSTGSPQNVDYNGIIASSDSMTDIYIRNIDNLWNIGNFPYTKNAFCKFPESGFGV